MKKLTQIFYAIICSSLYAPLSAVDFRNDFELVGPQYSKSFRKSTYVIRESKLVLLEVYYK